MSIIGICPSWPPLARLSGICLYPAVFSFHHTIANQGNLMGTSALCGEYSCEQPVLGYNKPGQAGSRRSVPRAASAIDNETSSPFQLSELHRRYEERHCLTKCRIGDHPDTPGKTIATFDHSSQEVSGKSQLPALDRPRRGIAVVRLRRGVDR